ACAPGGLDGTVRRPRSDRVDPREVGMPSEVVSTGAVFASQNQDTHEERQPDITDERAREQHATVATRKQGDPPEGAAHRAAPSDVSGTERSARPHPAPSPTPSTVRVRSKCARLGAQRGVTMNPVLEPLIKTVRATHPKVD